MSMCSCGARKVAKTETKKETHSSVADNSTIENKSETNVKTTTTVNVDDKNETVTEDYPEGEAITPELLNRVNTITKIFVGTIPKEKLDDIAMKHIYGDKYVGKVV